VTVNDRVRVRRLSPKDGDAVDEVLGESTSAVTRGVPGSTTFDQYAGRGCSDGGAPELAADFPASTSYAD